MVRIACSLALLAACAVEDAQLSSVESPIRCDLFICGENAASAGDGLLFDEVNLFGEPNHAGVKLAGARHGGVTLQLDIQGDRMRAFDPSMGAWRTDGSLIGTILKFQSSSGEVFEVLIEDFNEGMVSYRAGEATEVPLYLMKYRRPARGQVKFERYACERDVIDADWPSAGQYALVFRGDRFDQKTKRVLPNDPSSGWSFFACAGSAAGKLHLLRHTYAGGLDPAGPYPTTIDQRTTLLKAITSDYCGSGTPQFTVTGNPLTFTAAAPFTMPALAPIASYEALWSPDGAMCLDVPRRDPSLVPLPAPYVRNRAAVQAECPRTIPPCDPWWTFWWPWFGGYAITANPA